jgi:hypothetical protein
MDIVNAREMSPAQRVLAMETLWETMCQDPGEVESPDWHGEILAQRRERIAAGVVGFVPLERVRELIGR